MIHIRSSTIAQKHCFRHNGVEGHFMLVI